MNEDCQIVILETMDLSALANMAETNQHFYRLARGIFNRKYAKKHFEINCVWNVDEVFSVYESEDEIQIINYHLLMKVLKLFGSGITRLRIDYGNDYYDQLTTRQAKEITKFIRNYCYESIIELTMGNCKGSELEEMRFPSKNAQNLTIGGQWQILGSNTLKFDEIFPELRFLVLGYRFSLIDKESIVRKYLYSEHLHVEISQNEVNSEKMSERDLEKVLSVNPHIQSLYLAYVSENFLKNVSKALPNLENLELFWLCQQDNNFDIEEIVFETVKKLKI